MKTFGGTFFDGSRAVGVPMQVEGGGDGIVIADAVGTRRLRYDQVTVDAPVPGVRRLLRLPGGELIETDDGPAVEALWPTRSGIARIAFMLESRWWAALASLFLTAVVVWTTVAYLLPLAANPVSRLISPKFERLIGESTLATLDRFAFKPSLLTEAAQKEFTNNFKRFVHGDPDTQDIRLEFRKARAANAFALPGGIIVVTDEMVATASGDYEFFAVVAHEIGHIHGRHAMRMVLQDSGLAVLMTAIAGDAVGTTILAAALPSVLLRSRYSRQFETEADDYAFAMLKRHGVSPRIFADMLRRLQNDKLDEQRSGSILEYLSSHPATEERIRRAEEQR
jgi:predicted Zn-dependent protease